MDRVDAAKLQRSNQSIWVSSEGSSILSVRPGKAPAIGRRAVQSIIWTTTAEPTKSATRPLIWPAPHHGNPDRARSLARAREKTCGSSKARASTSAPWIPATTSSASALAESELCCARLNAASSASTHREK